MSPSVRLRAMVGALALLALCACAPAAHAARTLYVPNFGGGADTLSAYAVGPNSSLTAIGAPIATGAAPEAAVTTPDGRFLFVSAIGDNRVERYSVAANGSLTALGNTTVSAPRGLALSPDGSRLYVAGDTGVTTFAVDATGGLSSLGTRTLTNLGRAIALTPDGRSLYVTTFSFGPLDGLDFLPVGTDGVPTADGTEVDSDARDFFKITITPDGRFLYIAWSSLISPAASAIRGYAIGPGGALTPVPGSPFTTGGLTTAATASPAAPVLFATEDTTDTARAYSIGASGGLTAVGTPLPTADSPFALAVTPGGGSLFAASFAGNIARFDVAAGGGLSSAGADTPGSGVGQFPSVSPNQGPSAAFAATAVRSGIPTDFNASGSTDPDGTVARYDWDFGDGTSLPNGGPTPQHTYFVAGAYNVTVTVTDNEGCSRTKTYTGQIVGCNPSGAATTTKPVEALGHPLPVAGISISKVSANRYCIGKGTGTAKDPAFTFTLSDPANVSFAVQRRTTPVVKPKKTCPVRKPGGPGSIPVQYSDVVTPLRGERYSTVKPAKTKKARAAAALAKTLSLGKGVNTVKLSALIGKSKLAPGWYRLLISAKRADGSASQFVTVKFWVLDTTKAKKKP